MLASGRLLTGCDGRTNRSYTRIETPSHEPEEWRDVYSHHEETVVDAFRHRVSRGDSIVVVGDGSGTTTVVAARMTHYEGAATRTFWTER